MSALEWLEHRSYQPRFADLLRKQRAVAGKTVREVGKDAAYSHSTIVRAAASGARFPTWDVTTAFLKHCGVGDDSLPGWHTLWFVARDTRAEVRRHPTLTADRVWFWQKAERDWAAALEAIRRPDALAKVLRILQDPDQVVGPREIGVAITTLAGRSGSASARGIADRSNFSKTSVHGWLTGKRKLRAEQLDALVEALGATPAERHSFAAAHKRVFGSVCGEAHDRSGLPCILPEFHRGYHRTASGREWLEVGADTDEALTRLYDLTRGRDGTWSSAQ